MGPLPVFAITSARGAGAITPQTPLLTAGEQVTARVLSAGDGTAVLLLGGAEVGAEVEARVDSPLVAGARVLLQVQGMAEGRLLLRLVSSQLEGEEAEPVVAEQTSFEDADPVHAALVRASTPVSRDATAAVRQSLGPGEARRPETAALMQAVHSESPELAAALDAVLDEDAPRLGALLSRLTSLPPGLARLAFAPWRRSGGDRAAPPAGDRRPADRTAGRRYRGYRRGASPPARRDTAADRPGGSRRAGAIPLHPGSLPCG